VHRRHFVLAALSAPALARAHHGWSSFDQDRPVWLEGEAVQVRWQNPHAELVLQVPPDLRVPPDLASRSLPAQTAPVDGKSLLARAQVPRRKEPRWEVELAPLTRLRAWQVDPIQPRRKKAIPWCGPSTCSSAAGCTACARRRPEVRGGRRSGRTGAGQLDRAARARAVISSTVPMPLMARYLGALTGSALAQSE
jgi:hypothetical protein